jgi:hypothetical protein
MRKEGIMVKAILTYLIGMAIIYIAMSFYWISFDFSKWGENTRGLFSCLLVIWGGLSALYCLSSDYEKGGQDA